MSQHDNAQRITVLFAGGGTGGHLMPGLSVADELRRSVPESRSAFAGTFSEFERRIVEEHGFEFHGLPSLKWTGSALAAPAWALRSMGGLFGARKLVQDIQPDLVVSLGGYAALAPCLAARLANIPLVILEQNAYPGKVNRLLSWWAGEVHAPWPGMESLFAYPDRVFLTGNPVRAGLCKRPDRNLAETFDLSSRKRTLLVMGGSQGARAVNHAIAKALPLLEKAADRIQILHSTGRLDYDEVCAMYGKSRLQAVVRPYIDNMHAAYSISSLAMCRAGGTTLAELAAVGIPSVLVPLPIAAEDHQRHNAEQLADAGAAVILAQADLTPDTAAETLLSLLDDELRLSAMREACTRIGYPSAARNVVARLTALLTQDQWFESMDIAPSLLEGG